MIGNARVHWPLQRRCSAAMSWGFDTTQRSLSRSGRTDERGAPPLATTTMRVEFDERFEGELAARCVETREEQRGHNLLKLAIERVPLAVIADLEKKMRAEVSAARAGNAPGSTAVGAPGTKASASDAALFSTIVDSEIASGRVTGIVKGKPAH